MRGLLKGLWIILVIFTLSPLFGKWYKTSLVFKGLFQAAWCCLWFSLLFAQPGFFFFFCNLHTRKAVKQFQFTESWSWVAIFKNVSLKIIKNLRYVVKDLLDFATNKLILSQPACIYLYFSLFIIHMWQQWELELEPAALETTTIRLWPNWQYLKV